MLKILRSNSRLSKHTKPPFDQEHSIKPAIDTADLFHGISTQDRDPTEDPIGLRSCYQHFKMTDLDQVFSTINHDTQDSETTDTDFTFDTESAEANSISDSFQMTSFHESAISKEDIIETSSASIRLKLKSFLHKIKSSKFKESDLFSPIELQIPVFRQNPDSIPHLLTDLRLQHSPDYQDLRLGDLTIHNPASLLVYSQKKDLKHTSSDKDNSIKSILKNKENENIDAEMERVKRNDAMNFEEFYEMFENNERFRMVQEPTLINYRRLQIEIYNNSLQSY